ncbi:ABC transporter permease [Sinomicrobium sp. M5D2P17]
MIKNAEVHIAKLFWKITFKNKAVYVLTLIIGILLAYAVFSGWENFKARQEIREKYQEQARQDWLDNPDKHPHRMAHYGHFAFRPQTPLSVFDFGMESFLGSSIFLEAHVQNPTNFSEAEFSTGMLRFGEISIAMILQILLPLLIFFLGFRSIAAERENGTLKILMSQGLDRKQLLLGKSLGMILVMSTLYFPIIIITILLWGLLQKMNIGPDETYRLLLIVILYFIYLSVFCVIAVIISALSRTSKTALTSSIGVWLLLTVLLPRAGQSLGAYLYPSPTKAAFQAEIENDVVKTGDSHNPDDPHYQALKDSVLTAYNVDSVSELPFNYSGLVMKEGEKITAKIHSDHLKKLRQVYARQNSFSRYLTFLDPYMGIKNLSMTLSGTDYNAFIDFQDQAEQYRYRLAQSLNDLQIKHVSNTAKSSADPDYVLDKEHWAEIEDFKYRPLRIGTAFHSEFISFLSFPFWVLLLALILGRLSKTLKVL